MSSDHSSFIMLGNAFDTPSISSRASVISTSVQNLRLQYRSLQITLSVPETLFSRASTISEQFLTSLSAGNDFREVPENFPPLSNIELASSYLRFLSTSLKSETEQDKRPLKLLLQVLLDYFDSEILKGENIYIVALSLDGTERQKRLIQSYILGVTQSDQELAYEDSSILKAVDSGDAKVYTIFGGQGNGDSFMKELHDLYASYNSLLDEFLSECELLLTGLSDCVDPMSTDFAKGIEILKWLQQSGSVPNKQYLVSTPISLPLIGVLQLSNYLVFCRCNGKSPGEFSNYLHGSTGHSQGIIVAAFIAGMDTWESFYTLSKKAITMLFWIGYRTQQAQTLTKLPPSKVIDSIQSGEAEPTPMLRILDFPYSSVLEQIQLLNQYLPAEKRMCIALRNNNWNTVVAGPPLSLYGLNLKLRGLKASKDADQSRIAHRLRKPQINNRFLSITVPFHSFHLEESLNVILQDLNHIRISSDNLRIPVYSCSNGEDLRKLKEDNLTTALVRLVTIDCVNWEKATVFPGATHILEFGPGGHSGVGIMTNRNKLGTGVRTILAGLTSGQNLAVGYMSEALSRTSPVKFGKSWLEQYGPKLMRMSTGDIVVDTKLSRLLKLPPIMVAGMTPTTACCELNVAVINGGYHVELAAGGFSNREAMSKAIVKICNDIPAGRGITINIIYLSPQAVNWQLALIRLLKAKNLNIEGLTVGGGVPSLTVATEYIKTLSLKHISFKPGSAESFERVIEIARACPNFPIIAQWTGGRGGGHHSYEDLHQPILKLYAKIRTCSNIILIVGSGLTDSKDSYPYLTGEWSTIYGYAPMPFDGCLFGSRFMVAKEARTCGAAKKAIVDAVGTTDDQWENTYEKETGGILTVSSELGQPIHKLATRGVKLWNELDHTLFNLSKTNFMIELEKRRHNIIDRLNADYHRVWFASNDHGHKAELGDMSYIEVLTRLVDLMFVRQSRRWIHGTYYTFFMDFGRRTEERFSYLHNQTSLVKENDSLDPYSTITKIEETYTEARQQSLHEHDLQYFLSICRRSGQKPVPFIPVLDENFETYFKKDSLWQCEDIEAVVGQDIGRTCILQGPVAAANIRSYDEPAKQILDDIHTGHVSRLLSEVYNGDPTSIPWMDDGNPRDFDVALDIYHTGITIKKTNAGFVYSLDETMLPQTETWLSLIAGAPSSWKNAFVTAKTFTRGKIIYSNPYRAILHPVTGISVEVIQPTILHGETIIVTQMHTGNHRPELVMKVALITPDTIEVNLYHSDESNDGAKFSKSLSLVYRYNPQDLFAPIQEIIDDRNTRIQSFYKGLWNLEANNPTTAHESERGLSLYKGSYMIYAKDVERYNQAAGFSSEDYISRAEKPALVPLDFAIVIGWEVIMRALLSATTYRYDLLKLIHLSNSFTVVSPDTFMFQIKDSLETAAEVTAIQNHESGKLIKTVCNISLDSLPRIKIESSFLIKGSYEEVDHDFSIHVRAPSEMREISPRQIALLKSRKWLSLYNRSLESLVKKTLIFEIRTKTTTSKSPNKLNIYKVLVSGQVFLKSGLSRTEIGKVEFQRDTSSGEDDINDFLLKHATPVEHESLLENKVMPDKQTKITVVVPLSNCRYARASGDYNPIHVSPHFAELAGLPGTITHGMWTSSAVRQVIEQYAANGKANSMHTYSVNFEGTVLPGDILEITYEHAAMRAGRKIIRFNALNSSTGAKVLSGSTEIEPILTAYVFTGQGSQEINMGMKLRDSSAVARKIWDEGDEYFENTYGFVLSDIVANNPKELTIYFGGQRGRKFRQNYLSMVKETKMMNGKVVTMNLFKGLTDTSPYYTFQSSLGLLNATQFTQPALAVVERAIFEHLRSLDMISDKGHFAGHSLGEYCALGSIAEITPFRKMLGILFYRGMTMANAVERNTQDQSKFALVAVNPLKISPNFRESDLKLLIDKISREGTWLLEIVNYNVYGQQYVCAGEVQALDCLTEVINKISTLPSSNDEDSISVLISETTRKSLDKSPYLNLSRGRATIPLRGLDVPFHSSFLRSGVDAFREILLQNIAPESINFGKLNQKWIPNVTALPFTITRGYFELVYSLTKSPVLERVLENWENVVL